MMIEAVGHKGDPSEPRGGKIERERGRRLLFD